MMSVHKKITSKKRVIFEMSFSLREKTIFRTGVRGISLARCLAQKSIKRRHRVINTFFPFLSMLISLSNITAMGEI